MSKPSDLRKWIQRMREHLRTHDFGLGGNTLLDEMINHVDKIEKRLDAEKTEAKVLIALYPEPDHQGIVVLAGTVPVMVVSVDHRPDSPQHLRLDKAPVLAVPTEFIEVVSDEAASYLQAENAAKLSQLIN